MNDLKYVIVQLNGSGNKIAIIFNGLVNHSMVVQHPFIVCSAGFCKVECGEVFFRVTVWGESNTIAVPGKYTLICLHCGNRQQFQKRPKAERSCGVCSPRRFNRDYLMILTANN